MNRRMSEREGGREGGEADRRREATLAALSSYPQENLKVEMREQEANVTLREDNPRYGKATGNRGKDESIKGGMSYMSKR